jgi:hypothetical protein
MAAYPLVHCRTCQTLIRKRRTYCSNTCQLMFQSATRLQQWKLGRNSGLNTSGLVSKLVKTYLRKKFANACCLCGWSVVNSYTGRVPLVADHIDGNWKNNREENLRLICHNCDALSATFAGANKGRGRQNRVKSIRAKEAALLVSRH